VLDIRESLCQRRRRGFVKALGAEVKPESPARHYIGHQSRQNHVESQFERHVDDEETLLLAMGINMTSVVEGYRAIYLTIWQASKEMKLVVYHKPERYAVNQCYTIMT
jgi:hypothetical protein